MLQLNAVEAIPVLLSVVADSNPATWVPCDQEFGGFGSLSSIHPKPAGSQPIKSSI